MSLRPACWCVETPAPVRERSSLRTWVVQVWGVEIGLKIGWLVKGGREQYDLHAYGCAVCWGRFFFRKEAIWLLYEYTRNRSCWICEALVDGPRSGGSPSNHQSSANNNEKIMDQAQLHDYIKFFIHSWISFESDQNVRNPFVEASRPQPPGQIFYQSANPPGCTARFYDLHCLTSSGLSFLDFTPSRSHHMVSQPPLLISASNFLAIIVGIPCCNQTLLYSASYLF